MTDKVEVQLTVNGQPYRRSVEPRLLLTDFLRHDLGLTGTHVGCEHGVCGACTILVDDEPVRACLMLAVQANDCTITTVEGLAPSPTELHPLQAAFWEAHGLQCGFCTAGILMSMVALLREHPRPTDGEIRAGLAGNLCRCTGYQNIVKAVRLAADRLGTALTPTLSQGERETMAHCSPSPSQGGGTSAQPMFAPRSGRGVGDNPGSEGSP